MVMPTFDETMYPLLDFIKDGRTYRVSEISDKVRDKYFNLNEEEKKRKVNNGKTQFHDRFTWGRTYLKKAGLVEDPAWGYVKITEEGKKLLETGITKIDQNTLYEYQSFKNFKEMTKKEITNGTEKQVSEDLSPTDLLELGYNKLNSALKQSIIEKLKSLNPYFFEKVVLRLLHKMGYGDFIETSKSNDGGIDGIINQDELGVDKIYIQCKRYSNHNVHEPDIRNFIGAMCNVSKGIFVTTSDFDYKAIEKAKSSNHQKIILINGEQLADLMIKYNVGTQEKDSYIIKEIDNDFFEEE